jgi:hypothetical protein
MNLGYLTTLSVECDAVKLGLDASVLKVASTKLHGITYQIIKQKYIFIHFY